MTRRRTLVRSLLGPIALIAFVLGLAEGTSFVALRLLSGTSLVYLPPDVGGYADYLRRRDPVLGWPPVEGDPDERDETGSRVVPAFPESRRDCLAIYGDSFTWSSAVDAEHAWGNVLSRRLGCRVGNYGVGGYGSDQALLRYQQHPSPDAPVVILGHLAENILRNLNQYQALLYPQSRFGLKPRFLLVPGDGLQLIPLPDFSPDEFSEMVERPAEFLRHDWFVPGGPGGVVQPRFPYTWSLLSLYRNFHLRAKLTGEPRHAAFYRPDHPSRGLALTAAILERFDRLAGDRGRTPVVMILPTGADLQYYAGHGEWVYQPLIDRLHRNGIEAFNPGDGMMESLRGGDPCQLFESCAAHYNERGYALLAQEVYGELDRRGLLPTIRGAAR